MIVSGCTGSGKTRFVKRLLDNLGEMYNDTPPVATLYCYGVYQDLYDEMKRSVPNIDFHCGLPDAEMLEELSKDGEHKLVILDDLQHKAVENEEIELMFTQYCHHRHLSCIFMQQNMYMQGKHSRTIALNCWYMVLMENVRDKLQVMNLARQMYPGQSQIMMEAYQDATSIPWGYLVVDTSPGVDSKFRLKTHIFPGEEFTTYEPTL